VIKGVNPFNEWLKLESREIDLYIEAAANPMVGDWRPTELGDKLTAPTEPIYKLIRADVNVFHEDVWELVGKPRRYPEWCTDIVDSLFGRTSTTWGSPRRANDTPRSVDDARREHQPALSITETRVGSLAEATAEF
jgi:hypothetical protein